MDCFFTPTLQQVTYFFFLQVPLSTNYFSASLTGRLRKRKEKACIWSPRTNLGGNTILEVLVASNLRQFAHLLQQIAAGTSAIRSSPPQLPIELRFAACGGV